MFGENGRWTRFGVYSVHLSVVLLLIGGLIGSIFGFDGSKKWMQRDGLSGTACTGSGAPMASGLKKSRGLRMDQLS